MKGWIFLFVAGLPLLCSADEFSVTYNGESVPPERIFKMSDLGLDDSRAVLYLQGWTVLLDEPGTYSFLTDTNRLKRLFLERDDGEILAGVRFNYRYESDFEKADISDLSPDLMKELMAVHVAGEPPAEVLSLLKHMDPSCAFFSVTEPSFGKRNPGAFPDYHADVEFMRIDKTATPNTIDYNAVSVFNRLQYLDFDTGSRTFDMSLFSGNSDLKYLNLATFTTLTNAAVIGDLAELRHLQMSYCDGFNDLSFLSGLQNLKTLSLSRMEAVTDIEFVQAMPDLEQLYLSGTSVSNLDSLAKCGIIKEVHADYTPIQSLPAKAIPSLRTLRVMNTPVTDEVVTRFATLNPDCRVFHRWGSLFEEEMQGISRVRVRTGGTCHVDVTQETTLFETSDVNEVRAFLDGIQINDERSGFHCMCCGNPTFELYRGERLVASIGFHHGQSLRWAGGQWPGDAALTEDSAVFLIKWLDEHGVSGPREEREYDEREAKASAIAYEKWEAAMPDSLRDIELDDSTIGRTKKEDLLKMKGALEKELPKENDQIRALLKWYGSGRGPWSGYPSYESVPEELLFTYTTAEILNAIGRGELTEAHIEGAARFFGGWDFSQKRKKDRKLIPRNLKKQLLEHSMKSDDDDKRSRARSAFGSLKG
jgi:hypothetical protein